MPIFDQGYRRYEGELRRDAAWRAIAWENFRTRMTRPVWGVLVISWLPAVIYGIVLYAKSRGLMGGTTTASSPGEVFPGIGAIDPRVWFNVMGPGSAYMFWNFFQTQTVFAMLVPAVACGQILGADRKTGALQIYFARPVTRADYLVGKFVAVAAFVAAVTFLPAMVLWLEAVLLAGSIDDVISISFVPFAAAIATLIYSLVAGGFCLALSSLFQRRGLAGISMMLVYLTGSALGLILSEALRAKVWRQFAPNYALGGIVAPFFGLDLPQWLTSLSLIFSCIALPLALLAWAWERTRSVEVET